VSDRRRQYGAAVQLGDASVGTPFSARYFFNSLRRCELCVTVRR